MSENRNSYFDATTIKSVSASDETISMGAGMAFTEFLPNILPLGAACADKIEIFCTAIRFYGGD